MNILFLTLSQRVSDIGSRGLYPDLLRCFAKAGHTLYLVYPLERRLKKGTSVVDRDNVHYLGVWTLNVTKTNVIEKGIGTLLLENQYLTAISRVWGSVRFDLVMYSTPPISFNHVVSSVKKRCGAHSYLLLKDIFPQNAIDLGMFSANGLLGRMFRRKERELYRISDHIGCMSPANVEFLLYHNLELSEEQIEVCPNSIELIPDLIPSADRKAILSKYGIPSDVTLFIYGGNLGKPQGIDFLLRVLEANKGRDDCFFAVVGSGTEAYKIFRWFESSGHPSNVFVSHALPKEDYDSFVRAADVGLIFLDHRFTIPNFPSRLLSYLECRMPVLLATDVNTDMGRIAQDAGFGFWSESGDLDGFQKQLDTLCGSSEIRAQMGEKGYGYLKDNWQVNRSFEIIMKHFQ